MGVGRRCSRANTAVGTPARPLCGRAVLYSTRHCSMVLRASASDQNQVALRH